MKLPNQSKAYATPANNMSRYTQPMLPTLTHLQFLVLNALAHKMEGVSATSLREILREQGSDAAGPKFYQMMRRLEEAKLAESWSQHVNIGSSTVSRTYYRATQHGNRAWQMTLAFYAAYMAPNSSHSV